ncbi:MAG: MBL fold metallo-hydrolase [Oscillospiraceae bacterium]
MKISFLGATHEVTGSCTLIETLGKNILIDCGMEQGADIFVNQDLPVNPGSIDCVLLTHAHIDHSGKLPLLCKNGFKGMIYATEETANLCKIMLMDSAHIQMFEAEWRNRKAKRSGAPLYEPLYTTDDAMCAAHAMNPGKYGETRHILENVDVRFNDMGHLLGSSSIEVWITEQGVTKKIVFSGDIGNKNRPIMNDPKHIAEADYVVMESTYGDRLHEPVADVTPMFVDCLQRTFDRGGNVVIPSFAVGRTQEMLYLLRKIKDAGLVKGHPGFPVYVDSPLANQATAVFLQSDPSSFDEETRALLKSGVNPLVFPDLIISETADESKQINFDSTPKVIISASGMCEAGRIRHHLKHNLWRRESLILFVGYQSNGTLGRMLLDGEKEVKLFGETINVEAEIAQMPGISGHADKQGLLDWIGGFETKPARVFVNHGEDEVCESFAKCLREEHGQNAVAPFSGSSFDLLSGEFILETAGIRIQKPERRPQVREQRAFGRLVAACEKLLNLAKNCEGKANKELARFAEQVEQLLSKWSN